MVQWSLSPYCMEVVGLIPAVFPCGVCVFTVFLCGKEALSNLGDFFGILSL